MMTQNNVYLERHHILPRCMGGMNEASNIIELPWSAHVMAHYLLAKELESLDKENSMKNYYAVRMCLNQKSIPNINDLKEKLNLLSIEFEVDKKCKEPRIWVKKEDESKCILLEELDDYLSLGWVKGRFFKSKTNGSVWVNDGSKSFQIKKEELDDYLNKGYIKGMFRTPAMKQQNHAQKGEYTTKGWKWVHKEGVSKLINPKELEFYIKEGWLEGSNRQPMLGKKNPHNEETCRKLSESHKGKAFSEEHKQHIREAKLKYYESKKD